MFEKNIELYEKYGEEFENYLVLDILQNNPTYILLNPKTCRYKIIDYQTGVNNFNTLEECLKSINQSYTLLPFSYNKVFHEMINEIYSPPFFSRKLYIVDFIYSVRYAFVGILIDAELLVCYYVFPRNGGDVTIEKISINNNFYEELYKIIKLYVYDIRA